MAPTLLRIGILWIRYRHSHPTNPDWTDQLSRFPPKCCQCNPSTSPNESWRRTRFAVTKPDSTIARAIRLGSDNASAATLAPTSPSETKQNIQLYAMILYVMSLIACTICWIVSGYQTDTTRIVPVIAESGNMFLAVVLAYVAAILAR